MMERLAALIRKRFSHPLPGERAQRLMAPAARMTTKEGLKQHAKPTEASVLILLYPLLGQLHTVLIERNIYEGVHSGQIGFPGGKVESLDSSHVQTALREAEEEIGIQEDKIWICGELSSLFIPPSKYLVFPVLGVTASRPEFRLDHREVQRIVEVPMAHFLNAKTRKHRMMKLIIHPEPVNTPYYAVDGHCVWGATAMIISELCSFAGDLF